jgi:hypothetical protein|tara:strand:+ start:567 stop:698 length:132 start_codon:yes stop_codon:yes gene_type:complete
MNKIEELIRKFKQQKEVLSQLNVLTSMSEELDKLIKETAKKVK